MKRNWLFSLVLAAVIVFFLVPAVHAEAYGESVSTLEGYVRSSYLEGASGDVVLTGDTVLLLDQDLTVRSIRGDYDLSVQDLGGYKLKITMPLSENVITANGSGHGIKVKSFSCSASLDILARKDGINADGDIEITGPSLAVTANGGDAVYSRNGNVTVSSTAMITAKGNCLSAVNGTLKYDGVYLLAETTGSDHNCLVGKYVNLQSSSITASSRADCIVSNGSGIYIKGRVTASSEIDYGSAINARNGGTVHIGENSDITATGGSYGIYASGSIIMDGSGTLNASTDGRCGICSETGNIVLKGDITSHSRKQAVYAPNGNITLTGDLDAETAAPGADCVCGKNVDLKGGVITVSAVSNSIVSTASNGGVILDGDITASSQTDYCAAVASQNGGSITINGGTLNITAGGWGLYSTGGIDMEAGTLNVNSGTQNAICASSGNIVLKGTVTAESVLSSVCADNGRVTVSGNTTLISGKIGIFSKTGVEMQGSAGSSGVLSIEAEREGILTSGNVTLTGKTVLINAGKASGIRTTGDVAILADAQISGAMEKDRITKENVEPEVLNLHGIYARTITLDGTMTIRGRCSALCAKGNLYMHGDITANAEQKDGDELYYVVESGGVFVKLTMVELITSAVCCDHDLYIYGSVRASSPDAPAFYISPDGSYTIGKSLMIISPAGAKKLDAPYQIRIGANPIEGTAEVSRTDAEPGDDIYAHFDNAELGGLTYTWESCPDQSGEGCADIGTGTFYTVRAKDAGNYIRFKLTSSKCTGELYSDWCYVLPDTPLTGSIVYTSGAKIGGKLSTARTGELNSIENTAPSRVHFQWQRSSDGETGWTDIPGATSSPYTVAAADAERYIRMTATVDGMSGVVCSPARLISKNPASGALSMSSISYANGTVTVGIAFTSQEYVMTLSASDPSESAWLSAVSPEVNRDPLEFPVSGSYLDSTVYVHTRFKETDTSLAGTSYKHSAVYTGTSGNLEGLTLSFSPANSYLKVNNAVSVTVSPLPASYPSGQWSGDTVNWYVNNDPKYPGAVELYSDPDCTQPLERDQYGNVVPTTQHKVYAKAASWSDRVTIGAYRTVGYNTIRDAQMTLNVCNESGDFILRRMTFGHIEAFPGDELTASFTTMPEKSYLGVLSFEARNTNPSGNLILNADTVNKTLTVTVPENAEPGVYIYDFKIDCAAPYSGANLSVTVKDKTATVSFDDGTGEMMGMRSRLLGSLRGGGVLMSSGVMPDRTVPLGSQYILPENGFDAPDGYEFDGWDMGEAGDGINVTEDVTVTAKWKVHVHSMTHTEAYENSCDQPGCVGFWYCESCGRYFGDENGLYGNYADPAMYMTPQRGHDVEGAAPIKINEVSPSCTEDGGYDMAVVCKICGKVASSEHTVVSATGHTPKAAIHENEHAASCEAAGSYDLVVYCDVCGAEISRTPVTVPAAGHSLQPVAAVAAKCEADGREAHYACENCGKFFADAEGTQEVMDLHDLDIPAAGHSWKAPVYEWSQDNSSVTASAVCEHDANHVYSETVDTICEVTVKPTPESAGSGTYTAVFSAPMFASQVKNAAIPYVPLSIKSVSVNGSAVSVKLNGDVPADAVLAAAAYSQNGAMLRTALLKPTGNTAELTLNTGGAAYVKVFLIAEDAYAPLCESIQKTVE